MHENLAIRATNRRDANPLINPEAALIGPISRDPVTPQPF